MYLPRVWPSSIFGDICGLIRLIRAMLSVRLSSVWFFFFQSHANKLPCAWHNFFSLESKFDVRNSQWAWRTRKYKRKVGVQHTGRWCCIHQLPRGPTWRYCAQLGSWHPNFHDQLLPSGSGCVFSAQSQTWQGRTQHYLNLPKKLDVSLVFLGVLIWPMAHGTHGHMKKLLQWIPCRWTSTCHQRMSKNHGET